MNQHLDSAQLALTLGSMALERKVGEVTIIDLRHINTFTDFMMILSGKSTRQVRSLAEHILRSAKTKLHLKPLGREGAGQGNWILLDYDTVVIHVFLDDIRSYYDLESLWSESPIHKWSDEGQPPSLE